MIPFGRWWNRSCSAAALGGLLLTGTLALVFLGRAANGLRPPAPWACTRWVSAAPSALGLPPGPDGSYRNEEGFAALTFNGRLYLGMEADNTLGARLWRTRAGVTLPHGLSDWEEVIADSAGRPFGRPDISQNDHVDSLARFGDDLYVTTANRSQTRLGFRVFRSPTGDPGSWLPAEGKLGPGFGDPNNENLKDLTRFDDWLCGGTWNETSGAAVWCTRDGARWQRKSPPGMGAQPVQIVWSLLVYRNSLYAAGQSLENPDDPFDDRALVYRSRVLDDSLPWELVFDGGAGSGRALMLGILGDEVLISARGPKGMIVRRSVDGAPGSWRPASRPGIARVRGNLDTIDGGAIVYRGALYLSVYNPLGGVQLWRTTTARPDDWQPVAPPGLNDYRNFAAVLTEFHGRLYAWTSNPALGQQILRAACLP